MSQLKNSLNYKDAGVDIDAGNALVERIKPSIKATARDGVLGSIGGFGGLFDLKALKNYDHPILVSATDGVGTKLAIAQAAGNHSSIGIDLVAMCVNDIVVQGAEPLFFLDYYATGKLNNDVAADVINGIAEGCKQAGCGLIGGETAEMPGMYQGEDYDLAGFSVGIVEKDAMLPRGDIADGDTVIGLPSSGIHSNGYSLVRHVLKTNNIAFTDAVDGIGVLQDALLTPTQIYVKPLLAAMDSIKALAHITGGGLSENIPRVLPDNLGVTIDCAAWTPQRLFSWLAEQGGIAHEEMLRTFNCGIGMVVIVSDVDAFAADYDGEYHVIGEVTTRDGDAVTYQNLDKLYD